MTTEKAGRVVRVLPGVGWARARTALGLGALLLSGLVTTASGQVTGQIVQQFFVPFPETDFNQDHIVDFVLKNSQLLRDPAYHIGAWNDEGKVYLDISAIAKTPEEAVALSRQHDQIAYYDLNKGVSVDVDRSATSGGLKK